MSRRIYLDYNASTPAAPEVRAAMAALLDPEALAFGNPSSLHFAGGPARAAVERARAQVATAIGAAPDELVFTSGGSEASNAAIKGAYFARALAGTSRAPHLITTAVEHPATLAPCRFLERLGARLTVVPVDGAGRVSADDVARALEPDTALVSVMHANNEVGTLQPIAEIARHTRARGVLLHVDAAQSLGKVPVRVDELGCDLLSIAGHKLYAPKGVGALYVRRGVALEPLVHGAGHEAGRRAGTESAALAAGLGAAAELVPASLAAMPAVEALRERLWAGVRAVCGGEVALHGHPSLRLPNTLNVGFRGREGARVLRALEGVAASTGSACHAGSVHLSPVLAAMGVSPETGMGAVRFSLGRATTEEEVDEVLAMLRAAWPALLPEVRA